MDSQCQDLFEVLTVTFRPAVFEALEASEEEIYRAIREAYNVLDENEPWTTQKNLLGNKRYTYHKWVVAQFPVNQVGKLIYSYFNEGNIYEPSLSNVTVFRQGPI